MLFSYKLGNLNRFNALKTRMGIVTFPPPPPKGNNRMISSESMLRVVSSVPHLTQLRLSNCSVSEAVVQAVAATCPHLKVQTTVMF